MISSKKLREQMKINEEIVNIHKIYKKYRYVVDVHRGTYVYSKISW